MALCSSAPSPKAATSAPTALYLMHPARTARRWTCRGDAAEGAANLATTTAQVQRYKCWWTGGAGEQAGVRQRRGGRGQAAADVAAGKAAVASAQINLLHQHRSPIAGRTIPRCPARALTCRPSAATLLTTVQQIDRSTWFSQSSVDGLRLPPDVASGQLKPNGPPSQGDDHARGRTQYAQAGTLQFSGVSAIRARLGDRAPSSPSGPCAAARHVRARSIDQGVNDAAVLVPQVGSPTTRRTATVLSWVRTTRSRSARSRRPARIGDQWVVDGG